jgi:flagellar L-ring protein precursor FlgH
LLIRKSIKYLFLFIFFTNSSFCFANSLWTEGKGVLFTDRKARNVGDIVTVLISEQTTTKRSASKKTEKSTSIDGEVGSWFSIDGVIGAFKNILSLGGDGPEIKNKQAASTNLPAWNVGATHTNEGEGELARKDMISARITCRIIELFSNGLVKIEGKQSLVIDGDSQDITLKGVVRIDDITAENTIISYNVADAEIVFGGKGQIADKQKRGLLEKITDFIWPF